MKVGDAIMLIDDCLDHLEKNERNFGRLVEVDRTDYGHLYNLRADFDISKDLFFYTWEVKVVNEEENPEYFL